MPIPRRALIVLVVLLALAAGALIALEVVLSPARIKAAAVAHAKAASGYDLEIERAHLGLAGPGLAMKLDGVRLTNPQRAGAEPFLRLAHLDVGVEILPLLRRQVRITRLVLVRPELLLVKDARGALNTTIEALPGGSAPQRHAGARSGALLLAVPAARITGGTLRYVDEGGRSEVTVTDLGGDLAARIEADTLRLRIDLAAGGLRADMTGAGGAAYGPLPARLRVDLVHALASGMTFVRDATLALAAIDLRADGRIETPPAAGARVPASVDLAFASGEFAPEKVLSLLGRPLPAGLGVAGQARLAATVRGPLAAPAIQGVLTLAGVDVTPPGKPAPLVTALSGDVVFTRTGLAINDLHGAVSGAPFAASATVTDYARPAVAGRLRGRARLADLAALLPLAPGTTLERGVLAVDVDFETRAPNFARGLALFGTVTGDSIAGRLPGLPVPVTDLAFTARCAGRQATCEPFRVVLGRSDLAGRITLASLDPPRLDVALRADRLDLDELLARPAGAPGAAGPAPAGGREAPPLLPLRGTLGARELIVRGLSARDATLRLDIDGSGFRADQVRATLLGGRIEGDLAIDLAAPDSLRYRSHLVVRGAEAAALLAATTPLADLVSGRLDARVDLDGIRAGATPPLALLTALGDVTVTDGRLALRGPLGLVAGRMGLLAAGGDYIEFQRMVAVFRVEQGRVHLSDTRIAGARAGEFELAGSVGFDGTLDYAVSALLPVRYLPPEIRRREDWVAALTDESGRFPVDFAIGGTIREPRVRVDTRQIEERLAAEVGRQVREQLDAESAKQLDRVVEEAARGLERLFGKKRTAAADSAGGGRDR